MNEESSSRSFGRTALAAVVLLVAAWLLLVIIGHVLSFLFSTVILVAAVVGVIWALRILL
jgi:preprotein translocase subunit SecF